MERCHLVPEETQNDRAQLKSLGKQLSRKKAQARIEDMVDSYSAIEASLEQAVQEQGVEDAVNWAVQRAQDDVGQAGEQMQEAEQVAHGTQQILG